MHSGKRKRLGRAAACSIPRKFSRQRPQTATAAQRPTALLSRMTAKVPLETVRSRCKAAVCKRLLAAVHQGLLCEPEVEEVRLEKGHASPGADGTGRVGERCCMRFAVTRFSLSTVHVRAFDNRTCGHVARIPGRARSLRHPTSECFVIRAIRGQSTSTQVINMANGTVVRRTDLLSQELSLGPAM